MKYILHSIVIGVYLLAASGFMAGQGRSVEEKTTNHVKKTGENSDKASEAGLPESAKSLYTTEGFDPSVSSLPSDFYGHDIRDLYIRLAERQSTQIKDEFETTENYLSRIRAAASQPILGRLTTNDIFVFQLKPSTLVYDADHQVMKVTQPLFNMKRQGSGFDYSKASISVLSEDKYGSYAGSNAFGASVEIIKQTGDHYDLAIEKPIQLSLRFGDLYWEVNMDILTAMEAKQNLRLLAICELRAPLSREVRLYEEPTFDHPTETNIKYHYVIGELKGIWLYDLKTGKIFAKERAIEQ